MGKVAGAQLWKRGHVVFKRNFSSLLLFRPFLLDFTPDYYTKCKISSNYQLGISVENTEHMTDNWLNMIHSFISTPNSCLLNRQPFSVKEKRDMLVVML